MQEIKKPRCPETGEIIGYKKTFVPAGLNVFQTMALNRALQSTHPWNFVQEKPKDSFNTTLEDARISAEFWQNDAGFYG